MRANVELWRTLLDTTNAECVDDILYWTNMYLILDIVFQIGLIMWYYFWQGLLRNLLNKYHETTTSVSCYSVLPVGNTDLLQQTTGNSEFNSEGVHAVPEWATQCTQKNCISVFFLILQKRICGQQPPFEALPQPVPWHLITDHTCFCIQHN